MPAVNNPAFRGIQLEPVDGGEVGRQRRMHFANAPSSAKRGGGGRSWFHCCAKKEEGESCATTLFTYYTYATIGLDVTDGVFDYVQVAELAQHQETQKHAAWLGVCTTIALLLELVVKTKMRRKKDGDTAEGRGAYGSFGMNHKQGRDTYIGLSGLMELAIFLVEDATTVFVWWQTGTYNANNGLAQANLITTVVSAVGAATAALYGLIRLVKVGGNGCDSFAWILGIIAALFVAALAFWAVVVLTTIQSGDSYACIGSCVTTTTTTTLLAGSDALVLGSGSSFGSGESGAGEGGKDVGLNRAAIGMYVIGWIVAVLGVVLTTALAFGVEI